MCLFARLGYSHVKAAHKTLVKLTPGVPRFSRTFLSLVLLIRGQEKYTKTHNLRSYKIAVF